MRPNILIIRSGGQHNFLTLAWAIEAAASRSGADLAAAEHHFPMASTRGFGRDDAPVTSHRAAEQGWIDDNVGNHSIIVQSQNCPLVVVGGFGR